MENKLLKIDNIMYRVKDLKEGERFYTEVLGLKKVWEDTERKMIGFKLDQSDAEIVIHASPDLGDFEFSYLVENVEEFIKEREGQGLKLTFGPVDVRTGKYAVLEDPDGNQIPIIDLTSFGGKPRYD
jgi:catechol 2,3-dioxygenase-like lactoylglutathione lyase family enzyme